MIMQVDLSKGIDISYIKLSITNNVQDLKRAKEKGMKVEIGTKKEL